jgi:hypothetical protein
VPLALRTAAKAAKPSSTLVPICFVLRQSLGVREMEAGALSRCC